MSQYFTVAETPDYLGSKYGQLIFCRPSHTSQIINAQSVGLVRTDYTSGMFLTDDLYLEGNSNNSG